MTNRLMKWFNALELGIETPTVNREVKKLADFLDRELVEGPEKTVALRKLMEVRDNAIRAVIEGGDTTPESVAMRTHPLQQLGTFGPPAHTMGYDHGPEDYEPTEDDALNSVDLAVPKDQPLGTKFAVDPGGTAYNVVHVNHPDGTVTVITDPDEIRRIVQASGGQNNKTMALEEIPEEVQDIIAKRQAEQTVRPAEDHIRRLKIGTSEDAIDRITRRNDAPRFV